MPATVAPWLADLDEDWVQPATVPANPTYTELTSASHDANSLGGSVNRSRIPRRSSSGQSQITPSGASSQKRRMPLSQLNSSANNAMREASLGSQTIGARSVSVASADSVVHYDTMARSKSASPRKQPTLEWKKRLVGGEVGYGDQTDLFGPSGLENIFQSPARRFSSRPSSQDKSILPSFSRTKQQVIMPSSPPPWPSNVDLTLQSTSDGADLANSLNAVEEELLDELLEDEEAVQGSVRHVRAAEESPHAVEQSRLDEQSGLQDPDVTDNNDSVSKPSFGVKSIQRSTCRTVSGESDLQHEELSPVFVSKHTTVSGTIGYTPLDSNLVKQMEAMDLRSPRPLLNKQSGSRKIEDSIGFEDTDLPTGTPPLTKLGEFVNVRRGGLSNHGSFKNRPLSPSPSEHPSFSAVEEPMAQSTIENRAPAELAIGERRKNTVDQPSSPLLTPTTPVIDCEQSRLSPRKTRGSASPLKLFSNHDTFTNNRLLRRMSQLEDVDPDEPRGKFAQEIVEESAIDDAGDDTVASRSLAGSRVNLRPGSLTESQSRNASKLSNFGEGELDERDFEADFSFSTGVELRLEEPSSEGSPLPETVPPGSRTPFRFYVDQASQEFKETLQLKRKFSKRSTIRSQLSDDREDNVLNGSSAGDATATHDHGTQTQEFIDYTEGKRPQSSPIKAPTPKRRRTLHALEQDDDDDFGYGSVAYRKRESVHIEVTRRSEKQTTKSTHHFSTFDTDSVPQRQVSRPRNPTPSQARRQQVEAEIEEATAEFMASSPRLEAIKEQIEASELPGDFNLAEQAKAVASEVAAFTLNVSKANTEGERKRSITTQDFLDEAMHIMSMIRARGRPQSGLGSLEESDAEEVYGKHLHPEDVSFQRSPSPLRLSRPPSREGQTSGWRPRSENSQDPRVVSQLRRFAEKDDIDLVDTSVRSLHFDEAPSHRPEEDEIFVEPSINIRISGPRSERSRERGESNASQPTQSDSFKSHASNPSIDSSSGRTVNTSSTRRSENVATLAPETVAHLIPEEVAGMTFDRDKQKWIRARSTKRSQRATPTPHSPTPTSNVTSDDDPFGDIPDLTVDEVKELHHIQHACNSQAPTALQSSKISAHDQAPDVQEGSTAVENRTTSQETVVARPVTSDSKAIPPFNSSSVPSKNSAFESSEPQIETRATSWSNEELACLQRRGPVLPQFAEVSTTQMTCTASVESAGPTPEEEHNETKYGETTFSAIQDDSLPLDDSDTEELPALPQHRDLPPHPVFPSSASVYRGAARNVTRNMSLRRQTLDRGFYANVQHDQSELSLIAELPDKRLMSLSLSVSRPSGQSQELALPSSPSTRVDATLYLSDLPDFTMHQIDEAKPSEQALAKRVAQHEMQAASDRYSLSVQGLVKTLTDVEPDEPYWEDIKALNLHDRSLGSLHGLEDFCTHVQDLNISNNEVSQLKGAPASIRRLNARSNALSSLTAWGHLMNLQYLDISYNNLDSLDGLSCLIHLRELRADGNKITSLRGIMELDGLLKLRLRQNNVVSVDFSGCQL